MSKKVSKLELLPKKKNKNKATGVLKQAAVNGTLREILWQETQEMSNESIESINFTDNPETDEVFCLLPVIDNTINESEAIQNSLVVDKNIDRRPSEPTKPKEINSKKGSLRSKKCKSSKTKPDVTTESNMKVHQEPQTSLEETSTDNATPFRKRTYTEIMHKLKSSTLAAKLLMMKITENNIEEEEDEEAEEGSEEDKLEEENEKEQSLHENEVIDEDERLLSIVEERSPIARKLQEESQSSFIWKGIHSNSSKQHTSNRKIIVDRASMVLELLNMSMKLQEDRERDLMKREDKYSSCHIGGLYMCDEIEEEQEEENEASVGQLQRRKFRVMRAPSQRREVPLSVLEFATFWAHLLKEKEKRNTVVQKEAEVEVEEDDWDYRMEDRETIEQDDDVLVEDNDESSEEEEVNYATTSAAATAVACHRPFVYKSDLAAINPLHLKQILNTESSSDDDIEEKVVDDHIVDVPGDTFLSADISDRQYDHTNVSSEDKYPIGRDNTRLLPAGSALEFTPHSPQPIHTARTASMTEDCPRYSRISHPETLASLSCDSTDPAPDPTRTTAGTGSGSASQQGRKAKDTSHAVAALRVAVSSRRSTPHSNTTTATTTTTTTTASELPLLENTTIGVPLPLRFDDSIYEPGDESDTCSVETPRQQAGICTTPAAANATTALTASRPVVDGKPRATSAARTEHIYMKRTTNKLASTYNHMDRATAPEYTNRTARVHNPKDRNKAPIQTAMTTVLDDLETNIRLHNNLKSEEAAVTSSNEGPLLPPGCEHLRGIWPYDPSLQAFHALTQRVARSRQRRQMLPQRKELPLNSPPSENITEVCFDPITMALVLTSYRNGFPSAVSVALESIYLTQSTIPDMLTLRTRDISAIPTGYLGSFCTTQWNAMEREINASLAQSSHQCAYLSDNRHTRGVNNSFIHDTKQKASLKCEADSVDTISEVCGIDNTNRCDDTKKPSGVFSPPVFLTEPADTDALSLGSSGMWDTMCSMELPQDVSTNQLSQLAILGQTAFHQLSLLSADAKASVYCEYPQVPRPPPSLSAESLLVSQGASHSVIIQGGSSQTHRKHSSRKYRNSRFTTHIDIKPIDPSSRFMDLIKGAVEQYKKECEVLQQQQQRTQLIDAINATKDRENLEKSITSAYANSSSCDDHSTTSIKDPRTLRFYDPFSLNSSIGEVGYSASGYSALGDAVEIAIAGLAPFATVPAPMASPTLPRRPPQPSPTRTSHVLRKPSSSIPDGTAVIAEAATACADRSMLSGSTSFVHSPMTHRKLVEVPSVTREHISKQHQHPQQDQEHHMECKSINIDRRTGSPGSLLEASVAAAGEEGTAVQVVLLLESCPDLQLYFAKKFLQLDLAVDVFSSVKDAATAVRTCPFVYGIILLSLKDLYSSSSAGDSSTGSSCSVDRRDTSTKESSHLHGSFNRLFPVDVDRSLFTIIVHHSESVTAEERLLLHSFGVEMLLPQPYTLSALKRVVRSHAMKHCTAALPYF